MLRLELLIAKIGVDTAENGPRKGLQKCSISNAPLVIPGCLRGWLNGVQSSHRNLGFRDVLEWRSGSTNKKTPIECNTLLVSMTVRESTYLRIQSY